LEKLKTSLPEVWQLRPDVFRDNRGVFLETYHQQKLATLGIRDMFVQDNQSCSVRGTLRGLHYQLHHPQAKLCRVVQGQALDVAVDIRIGSPHFGKWASALLSSDTHNQIYIPPGFAHGFLALSEMVQLLYKCSDFYDPADDHGIIWNDPQIAIAWGISDPIVSAKDAQCLTLAATPRDLLPKYQQK